MEKRISEDGENYKAVFDGLLSAMDDVKQRRVSIEQGEVQAKAGYAAVKALEGDLHARMFANKLERSVAHPAIDPPAKKKQKAA